MSDMTQVIVPKSDQINADDMISGPMTIRIASVAIQGGTEQPVSMSFDGSTKVFRPCKSMSRVIVAAWGPDSKAYKGRSMTLYRDASVKWGGMEVGGIRISYMSHIDKDITMMLTMTKQSRAPHKVKVLQTAAPIRDEAAEQSALAAAEKGRDAFKAWWKDNPTLRASVTAVMDDCKARSEAWENANAPPPDDEIPLDDDQPM